MQAHDDVIALLKPKGTKDYLGRIRRQKFPACPDIDAFTDFLENNHDVKESFGKFRGKPFYSGTLEVGNERIVMFTLQQHLDRMQLGATVFFDGTFKIVPLGFKQLFVVLADIDGKNLKII